MGDDKLSEQLPHQFLKRAIKIVLILLWSSFVGLITGAIIGLLVIPTVASIVLAPDYEIQPWDGQFIGETVGLLIGLYVGMKKCNKLGLDHR